jgi:hypothetical protein
MMKATRLFRQNPFNKDGLNSLMKSLTSKDVGPGGAAAGGSLATIKEAFNMAFEDKEWKCHCGHVFRAPGEWYPTEPAYCEAPACPNPTFYLDGPGRAMLDSGDIKGKPLPTPGKTKGGGKPGGMGGRF